MDWVDYRQCICTNKKRPRVHAGEVSVHADDRACVHGCACAGAGPGDDRVGVLGGGARRREGRRRRGLLRAAAGRGAVGALRLGRRRGGGDPARHDGLLQPAERPPRPPRRLAAHPHPDPRRAGDVLGDHRLLRLGDYRAADGGAAVWRTRHLRRPPRPLRRRRRRRPRRHADGGEWTIDDVAFNVAGLCPESFIAPEEVRSGGGGGSSSSRRYDGGGGAIAKKK